MHRQASKMGSQKLTLQIHQRLFVEDQWPFPIDSGLLGHDLLACRIEEMCSQEKWTKNRTDL